MKGSLFRENRQPLYIWEAIIFVITNAIIFTIIWIVDKLYSWIVRDQKNYVNKK